MRLRAACLTSLLVCATLSARAQTSPLEMKDDVSMDTYLALLAQVAPAAREGAERYLAAYRAQCGQAPSVLDLRRGFAEGNGNPTLLAMVRAAHQRDETALRRLSTAIQCSRS